MSRESQACVLSPWSTAESTILSTILSATTFNTLSRLRVGFALGGVGYWLAQRYWTILEPETKSKAVGTRDYNMPQRMRWPPNMHAFLLATKTT